VTDVIQAYFSLNLVAVALWVAWVEYRRLLRGEVGRR
jgi:hypothetical protein